MYNLQEYKEENTENEEKDIRRIGEIKNINGTSNKNIYWNKKNILGRNNYFKVDTGAETNLIPNNIWILIPNRPKLMPINTKL